MGFIKVIIGRFEILSEMEKNERNLSLVSSTRPFLGNRLRDCQSHYHSIILFIVAPVLHQQQIKTNLNTFTQVNSTNQMLSRCYYKFY